MRKVLVVAVHPDDETLGCGGTLLKHKKLGDEINWLICTESKVSLDFATKREEEILKVQEMYAFNSVEHLYLQATRVDEYSSSDLVGRISAIINKVKPEILYIPFMGDVHSDHRHIFDAVYSCTKSFRYPFIKKILMMEVLSETEFAPAIPSCSFSPNSFVDITGYFDTKVKIMKIFKGEMADHPFPRSVDAIRSLALLRGARAGCKHAEAFMILKEIN